MPMLAVVPVGEGYTEHALQTENGVSKEQKIHTKHNNCAPANKITVLVPLVVGRRHTQLSCCTHAIGPNVPANDKVGE